MAVLGFEGTAHTLGIGLIDRDYNVLADVRRMYKPDKGGIHPREASRYIGANVKEGVDECLEEAGLGMEDIDLISFSQGPGLGACLRTTATASRALAVHHDIPILGVNHCIAHIEVARVQSGFKDPLVVYVSGANTQVIKLSEGRYRVFGETLDIGLGNMLDKFGRKVGLKHPAGPKIEKLAQKGDKYIKLPYTVKGTDLSFSGVLTSAIQKHKQKGEDLEDVCYSLQETVFSMLTEVSERALAHLKAENVVLTGGVGNNKRLQKMLRLMSEEHDAGFGCPEKYLSDNGVMIAMLGLSMHKEGIQMAIEDTAVDTKQRTDSIEVKW